jgi:8-oxo-dGTP diphosphatase
MTTVVCAIIIIENKIFAAQRSQKMTMPLKWEFPGGKLEQNEDEVSCIKREIKEELNIEIIIAKRLNPVIHKYSNFEVKLIPYVAYYYNDTSKLDRYDN